MSEQANISSKSVFIHATIDTEGVLKQYKPNNDPERPVFIQHNLGFMVAEDAYRTRGQGTGDLDIEVHLGDVLFFSGASASNNLTDAVVIDKISKGRGQEVIGYFEMRKIEGTVPLPDNKTSEQDFWFLQGMARGKGKEIYNLHFKLYTHDDSGNSKLYGYFAIEEEITVR